VIKSDRPASSLKKKEPTMIVYHNTKYPTSTTTTQGSYAVKVAQKFLDGGVANRFMHNYPMNTSHVIQWTEPEICTPIANRHQLQDDNEELEGGSLSPTPIGSDFEANVQRELDNIPSVAPFEKINAQQFQEVDVPPPAPPQIKLKEEPRVYVKPPIRLPEPPTKYTVAVNQTSVQDTKPNHLWQLLQKKINIDLDGKLSHEVELELQIAEKKAATPKESVDHATQTSAIVSNPANDKKSSNNKKAKETNASSSLSLPVPDSQVKELPKRQPTHDVGVSANLSMDIGVSPELEFMAQGLEHLRGNALKIHQQIRKAEREREMLQQSYRAGTHRYFLLYIDYL
jgi:hypothetical protein